MDTDEGEGVNGPTVVIGGYTNNKNMVVGTVAGSSNILDR